MSTPHSGTGWYRRFRLLAIANSFGALIWTVLIVLPVAPFSYLQPIIVGGGAGLWFLLAYLLYIIVGGAGLGRLSSSLHAIETTENRAPNGTLMWLGLVLLEFGVTTSCVLLGLGGALGGYSSTINGASTHTVEQLLLPYVFPTSVTTLVAAAGAGLALLAMLRARGAS